jgi:hypothetical protein
LRPTIRPLRSRQYTTGPARTRAAPGDTRRTATATAPGSAAIAIATNSRSPSLTAFHSASRSAHTASPNEAFSTLDP